MIRPASEAQRGVALDPNGAFRYEALSFIMSNTRKRAEAIGLAEKAIRLDSRDHDRYLYLEGWSYTQMGRYEEAIPILNRNLATEVLPIACRSRVSSGWLASRAHAWPSIVVAHTLET